MKKTLNVENTEYFVTPEMVSSRSWTNQTSLNTGCPGNPNIYQLRDSMYRNNANITDNIMTNVTIFPCLQKV